MVKIGVLYLEYQPSHNPMATSSGGRPGRHPQQKEAEDYLSRIKLREIFQVLLPIYLDLQHS